MTAPDPHIAQLGCYILGGRIRDPRPAISDAIELEQLGIGSVWISERFATKELGTLCGAVGAMTSRIEVVAGMTHFGERHPLVTASWGLTMQSLTRNRFVLGFSRGVANRQRKFGVQVSTIDRMEDHLAILRELWRGGEVSYEGPAGSYPELKLADLPPDEVLPPPVMLGAVGNETLKLAGRAFDGVVLHPFLTPPAVRDAAAIVRAAAGEAGRDPQSLRVFATVVMAPDPDPNTIEVEVRGRAASYFYGSALGEAVVRANAWDTNELERLRALPAAALIRSGTADTGNARAALREIGSEVPEEWINSGAAVGSPDHCAARLVEYLRAGADRILLHGVSPDRLPATVKQFAQLCSARTDRN